MRLLSVLFVLGCFALVAWARSSSETGELQEALSAARAALEQMTRAERKNSSISVEFESFDSEAVVLGHDVERLWNSGSHDEALTQLDSLEARVGHVAIGNSWRRPVPTVETGLWSRDVRIGNRDSILGVSLDLHRPSGNLCVALRRGRGPHFSVCMSSDSGASWDETFTWSGSPPTSIDAAVLISHFYVAYNSPGENSREVRMRRFLCSSGRADTFSGSGSWVVSCTLDVGDTMREVSLVSNPNNNRLYVVTLVSDVSVLVSVDDANAVSWARQPSGVTSGARRGLDATDDQRSDMTQVYFSYYDAGDTLRASGRSGWFTRPAGSGALTSISARLDTVICAYEDKTSSPHRVRYAFNCGAGDTWHAGALNDSSVAAAAPAVTTRQGGGFTAVFSQADSVLELLFCRRAYSGIGTSPLAIAEHEPFPSRPGIVDLGMDVLGVAYLSDTSPVVRGAWFDRSDWVYGIAGQRRLEAGEAPLNITPNPLRGHGRLDYALSSPAGVRLQMYDRAGSLVRTLFEGKLTVSRQSIQLDVSGMATGVYFLRLDTPGFRAVKKAVVAR